MSALASLDARHIDDAADWPHAVGNARTWTVRHAWLQKHPSPVARGGEFHWYPAAGDRELRGSFVERLRGVDPPAVLWQLEPERAAWGQAFSTTAPDGRRYVGLVLSVIEGEGVAAELLAQLVSPAPRPWLDGDALEETGDMQRATARRESRGDVTAVVRALLSDGAAPVADPAWPELPRWIASIASVVPASAMRRGMWTTQRRASDARDRVAELAAAAWLNPGSPQARAWTLLRELAGDDVARLDAIGAALVRIDACAELTLAERARLAAEHSVVEVLHAWGRGWFDESADAASLPARLAELVARRVLAQWAAGEDGGGAIAEARWHALLPGARRRALLAAVAERAPSLRALIAERVNDPAMRGLEDCHA